MTKRICIIQGHPDGTAPHFCHALADAYAKGAEASNGEIAFVNVADVAPELLTRAEDFGTPPSDPGMIAARKAISEAEHLVVIFPLWLGTMPAILKAFFEQMARAGFAIGDTSAGGWPEQRLTGKSARVIVTMGMPALAYRLWFLNSGVANLKRLILSLSGIRPVRQTTIGGIEAMDTAARNRWLDKVQDLGRSMS